MTSVGEQCVRSVNAFILTHRLSIDGAQGKLYHQPVLCQQWQMGLSVCFGFLLRLYWKDVWSIYEDMRLLYTSSLEIGK